MSANLHMANVVAIFILAFVLTNVNAEYDVAKYCQLVKIGTKLPSFDSCKTYYICNGSQEFTKQECPDKQVFNKDDANCIPESQSNCKIGVTNPCEGKDQTFATDLENCRMWHWCVGGKSAGKGTCLTGQYFNGTACVNGKCVNENFGSKVGTVTEVKNVCNIMKIGMFFGDIGDCAKWLKCVANDTPPKGGRCDEKNVGFILDLQLQACTPFSKAACERTGGSVPVNPEVSCENGKTRPDEEVCSKYYLCKDEKWSHISCPNQQYFDIEEKKCKDRQKATPFKNCDRCEFSNDKWVNAVDSKCTKFLTCKDGHKVSEGSCGDDAYFNEQRQVCLTGVTSIKDYVDKNGACVCNWECEFEKCKTDECKTTVCNNIPTEKTDDKSKCEIAKCKTYECKKGICNSYYDVTEKSKDNINCNLNICENEKCKSDFCTNFVGDKTYCKLQICQDHSCKDNICNAISDDLDNKVQCKIDACIDNTCKYDACDSYKNDPAKIWDCKHKICDGFIEAADKFNCKIKYCKDVTNADTCKTSACNSYSNDDDKTKCLKTEKCETGASGKDCRIGICNTVYSTPEKLTDKVKCKLNECSTDNCETDICNNIGNTNDPIDEEKLECKLQVCKDKKCKTDVCKTIPDSTEELQCKLKICNDNTDCKNETCDEHFSDEEASKINCKLNNCNDDQECKNNVCKDNAGKGDCPTEEAK